MTSKKTKILLGDGDLGVRSYLRCWKKAEIVGGAKMGKEMELVTYQEAFSYGVLREQQGFSRSEHPSLQQQPPPNPGVTGASFPALKVANMCLIPLQVTSGSAALNLINPRKDAM